ncbi:hypothetical protein D3C76_1307040 [compost metagenome]
MIVTEVVTHAGDVANVRNRNCRVARTVFTVATGQLFREVHGVAMGAAVTAGKHFTAGFETVCQQDRRTLDRVNIGFIFQKVGQRLRGFVQFVTNKILVHEDNPSVLMNNKRSVPDSVESEKLKPC